MPNTKTSANQLIAAVKRHVNNKKLRRERAPNIQEFSLPANNRFICIKSGEQEIVFTFRHQIAYFACLMQAFLSC